MKMLSLRRDYKCVSMLLVLIIVVIINNGVMMIITGKSEALWR